MLVDAYGVWSVECDKGASEEDERNKYGSV
jgi:hypothetical protein